MRVGRSPSSRARGLPTEAPQGLSAGHGPPEAASAEADCSVELGLLIRADGTQGVHAILSTNNTVYADALVAFIRRQQYERPLQAGIPLAIRYTSKEHLTRFGPAPEGDRQPGLPAHQRKTLGKHANTVEAKAKELGLVLDYDEPPKLLKTHPPKYPDEAFRRRRNGKVLVMAVVDASGHVLDAEVLESSESFQAAALDCVRGWKFKPAAKDGKPVGTVVTAPVSFTAMD